MVLRAPPPGTPAGELQALDAIRFAASRLGVSPEELRATSYRGVQRQSGEAIMPSESAIRAAFGSWTRARELAAAPTRRGL